MAHPVPLPTPRYVTTPDAAVHLGLSPRTLEKHRCYGTGPVFRKLGGRVVYSIVDLDAWAALGSRTSTSDPGQGIVHPAILTRRTRVVGFRPEAVFAFVRWMANDHGTIASRIDVVRAVGPAEPYVTLPFVRPGGDVLLHVDGWPKVQQVLRAIDAVEAAGVDPCDAAPDHWRHVHHRLAGGQPPRAYTPERHRAWLRRREIEG